MPREQSPGDAGLLERAAHCQALAALNAAAARGGGGVVVLEGPAGSGRSSLLDAAITQARHAGLVVALGLGAAPEQHTGHGVLRQLLRQAVLGAADATRRRALDTWPTAFQVTGPGAISSEDAYGAISQLAVGTGLLLCVDNAHWCDAASLDALGYLARRAGTAGIAIVVAVRPGTPEIREIEDVPNAVRLPLAPLSLSAVEQLAACPERARDVYGQAGGNPFLVRCLLDGIDTDSGDGIPPRLVVDEVARRYARAGATATRLAAAAAVLGDGHELSECARLATLDLEQAREAAAALAREEVLSSERPLRFSQPILTVACHASLPPPLRTELHTRAALLLRAQGVSAETAARHLLGADPCGHPDVARILIDASREAERVGALSRSIDYLRRALDEPQDDEVRAGLLCRLGRAESAVGLPQARQRLQAALRMATARPDATGAAIDLSRVLLWSGEYHDAVAVLDEALAHAPADDDIHYHGDLVEAELLALAQSSLAARQAVTERRDRLSVAHPPERFARSPGLLANLAIESAITSGSAHGAAAWANQALAAGVFAVAGSAQSALPYLASGTLVMVDHAQQAEQCFDTLEQIATAEGSVLGVASARCWRARARLYRGRLAEAEADARSALTLAREHGWGLQLPVAMSCLAEVLRERGRPGLALEMAGGSKPAPVTSLLDQLLLETRARLLLECGKPELALMQAEYLKAWEEEWGADNGAWTRYPWQQSAAAALRQLGDHERSHEVAQTSLDRAQRFGASRNIGLALHTLAMTVDDTSSQLELLAGAADLLGATDTPLDYARVLVSLGDARRRAGALRQARESLRLALHLADGCGADALVRHARLSLVACGARPRTARLTGPAALTHSERRVAELAAGGLHNAEIAAALYLSVKTVEMHLNRAYRKLDIRTRLELPRALGG